MENESSSIRKLKMQALSILQMPHSFQESNDAALVPLGLDNDFIGENEIEINNDENVEEQQDFSFVCFDGQGTLAFADEIFHNGKIRPSCAAFDQSLIFTKAHNNDSLSLQPPLKKLFVIEQLNSFSSQSEGISKGSCNETSQKMTIVEVETSSNKCNKSKSTSFSRTWRLREKLNLRSNSDGNDTFILLNHSRSMPTRSNETKEQTVVSNKGKGRKCKATLSPHEKFYMTNKKKQETTKRKSFLPYKQNLIGVFTNVNKFSRILNPFLYPNSKIC